MDNKSCILCSQTKVKSFCNFDQKWFKKVRNWRYDQCLNCGLVFMKPSDRLDSSTEKDRYVLHNNCADQVGYRRHLHRLWDPLEKNLTKDAKGLDYGSGPEPVLAEIVKSKGFDIDLWDPYFSVDKSIFGKVYDFIICNEVAEHFYEPGVEFTRIDKILRIGGFVALGTRFLSDEIDFENWTYRRDDTHVSFYNKESLDWLAHKFSWAWLSVSQDVAIAKKMAKSQI